MGCMEFDKPHIEEFVLTNTPVDEASRLVGMATGDPSIRIRCDIYEYSSEKKLFSMEKSPFAAMIEDDQASLRALTNAMSRGGTEFLVYNTIKRLVIPGNS